MKASDPPEKVIHLARKRAERAPGSPGSGPPARRSRKASTRVLAITSGKGGVGKTNIVANLGYAFSALEKKVLILDADMGLGNLDVLLGIAPRYNLSHVFSGELELEEVIEDGPGGLLILPASSGIQELTQLSADQKMLILSELDCLVENIDILLIDTAAGISSNVMDFNVSAHEIIVVVSPEPTSITDAYALMKVLSMRYSEKCCKLLVNMVSTEQEGLEVYRQLELVTHRFLDIEIEYLGAILFDDKITKGIKRQKLISELYPGSKASRCFVDLAKKISGSTPASRPKGNTNFFWHHLMQGRGA